MPARHPPGPQSDPYIRAHVVTPCHFTSMSQCHPALLNVSVQSDPQDWPGGLLQHVQATVTMAAWSMQQSATLSSTIGSARRRRAEIPPLVDLWRGEADGNVERQRLAQLSQNGVAGATHQIPVPGAVHRQSAAQPKNCACSNRICLQSPDIGRMQAGAQW